jgi:hypothetical protein
MDTPPVRLIAIVLFSSCEPREHSSRQIRKQTQLPQRKLPNAVS